MEEIFTRRSIRKYADKPVEKEKIERILRAGMQAPSAMNGQPWEFLVVQDKIKLQRLSRMSLFSKMVAEAPLALILMGDTKKMRAKAFFPQDMGAASENIMLEATHLGLGTVWLGVYSNTERENYIKDLFDLPESVVPFSIIVVGYPGDNQENKFVDRFDPKKIHYEKY